MLRQQPRLINEFLANGTRVLPPALPNELTLDEIAAREGQRLRSLLNRSIQPVTDEARAKALTTKIAAELRAIANELESRGREVHDGSSS